MRYALAGASAEKSMSRIESNLCRITLTKRQLDVLDGISRRQSIKQIAFGLQVSESAVNQHIKALKNKLEVGSLGELAEAYRRISDRYDDRFCRKTASRKKQLPPLADSSDVSREDDLEPVIAFHQPLAYEMKAPWTSMVGPPVVPRVLNGENAIWVRGAAIIVMAVGMLATVMIGLGVAQGVTSALSMVQAGPPVKR